MMMHHFTLTVTVTPADVENGVRCQDDACAVSLAVMRAMAEQFPDMAVARVVTDCDETAIIIGENITTCRTYNAGLPDGVVAFIDEWDNADPTVAIDPPAPFILDFEPW